MKRGEKLSSISRYRGEGFSKYFAVMCGENKYLSDINQNLLKPSTPALYEKSYSYLDLTKELVNNIKPKKSKKIYHYRLKVKKRSESETPTHIAGSEKFILSPVYGSSAINPSTTINNKRIELPVAQMPDRSFPVRRFSVGTKNYSKMKNYVNKNFERSFKIQKFENIRQNHWEAKNDALPILNKDYLKSITKVSNERVLNNSYISDISSNCDSVEIYKNIYN